MLEDTHERKAYMKKTLIALLLLLSVFIVGCTEQDVRYDVYVTVYPLQYALEEILADTGLTVGIVPGVTSHEDSVDWSPKEIIAMTEASLLFYVGANYDQYIDFQIESIFTNKDVELVKIEDETAYMTMIPGVIDDHDHEEDVITTNEAALGIDPHFWISPKRLIDVSLLLFDKVVSKYPDLSTKFTENYASLILALSDLDTAFTDTISSSTQVVMFSTNLYGYLREDYGLEYISISPGYHEETEQFTTQEKEDIVNDAVFHNITYIIYEKNSSSPLSNAIFTELETEGYNPVKLEYDILQALTDEDRSLGKDYISIMYDNLELLKQALGLIER